MIERCNICKPDYCCVSKGNGRVYLFERGDERFDFPESIHDCQTFKERIILTEPTDKPKLINQRTGEPYDKL